MTSSPSWWRLLSGPVCAVMLAACIGSSGSGQALGDPIRVPFESPLNLIVVEARINGVGPFRFVLDSGATGTVIDATLVKQLGLETGRANTRRSTSANSQVTAAWVKGEVEFEFAPGVSLGIERVIAAPFSEAGAFMIGEHFDGILGSAVFREFVVEVDYESLELTFHNPNGYEYAGAGAEFELEFPDYMPALPFIRTTLVNGDNRLEDLIILVDSGGQTFGTASVTTRRQWDELLTPDNVVVEMLGATGLSNDPDGTTHDAFITKMDKMIMGPFEFAGPLVGWSQDGPSVAVMGASLLHKFTMVLDYERKRMFLEPNGRFDEPLIEDKSGVMLVTEGDALKVMFVADRSPGHEAGLMRGDLIQSIDEMAVSQVGLNEARFRFCGEDQFAVEVIRNGEVMTVILETRSLFMH